MEDKKRKMAAALRYDSEPGSAPVVVAAGKGELAERIISAAQEYSIPVHRDEELASVLVGLNLSEEIPTDLYRAVAVVLALVFEADHKA